MSSIGFIGAGRISRIMIEGWARVGHLPENILLSDLDPSKVNEIRDAFPAVGAADLAAVAAQDIVIVSLHPPAATEVLPRIAAHLRPQAMVLSLAPKLRFAKLTELLGGFGRLARQNPNAPSIVNKGYNPIAFADGLDRDSRRTIIDLVAPLGDCPEVAEATIEAYALISAMGPTYLWFQLALLRKLGAQFGLSNDAAREAVAHMVHGAAATLLESDLPDEQVLDLVPVKPLASDEAAIAAIYRSRLEPLYAKLTS
jgi:pyrroline-5-carboxylate reductase